MYDGFSADYDRFVDWSSRLAVELDFLQRHLEAVATHRVLDVACGTGMHAIALARRGYDVVGVDASPGMIDQARANASREGLDLHLKVARFGELARSVGGDFDALLCLGNSLPHVSPSDLTDTLSDFAACLRPGGLLLVQNRNFDSLLASRRRGARPNEGRWMDPQSHSQGAEEWLFLRFYDFEPDGSIVFNLVTLYREGDREWEQRVAATRLHPLLQRQLTDSLKEVGFVQITCYGDMEGVPFDPERSGNLIASAILQ
jgi:SAM-dependent methyltransferase